MVEPISPQGNVNHSEFALETILSKGWGAKDFSEERSDAFIREALKSVASAWDVFHGQEEGYDIKTKRATEFKYTIEKTNETDADGPPVTEEVFVLPGTDRILIGEVRGKNNFYAKAEYIPPNLANGKAQIRVSVPLRSEVEGLESVDTTELRRIKEVLSDIGYRAIK